MMLILLKLFRNQYYPQKQAAIASSIIGLVLFYIAISLIVKHTQVSYSIPLKKLKFKDNPNKIYQHILLKPYSDIVTIQ